MRRTLLVTNDFPPRQGGIQTFLHSLVVRLPPDRIAVFASDHPGSAEFDATLPFPVVRAATRMLLPTPERAGAAVRLARETGTETVWFGAAAPLGLMAPALRRAGVRRVVATTHGHEAGWARLPVARQLLRRIGRDADVVTYLSDYTRRALQPVLGATELVRLAPGVDVSTFRPDPEARAAVRDRYGLGAAPTVVCVSRLVPRKGQDVLVEVWPAVRAAVPGATLLLVGGGRYAASLRRRAGAGVVLAGAVPGTELPAHYAAGDVFAMPCRTRRGGLDVEGLGIVFLEASATGLPVIVGDSGGAPDAVVDGTTGFLVDGRDHEQVRDRVVALLQDATRRREMGSAGRAWVGAEWDYDAVAARLAELL